MVAARTNGAGADVVGAFALAIFLTLVAVAIDDGTIGWLLAPIAFLALVYTMIKLPLRSSLMWITFCVLTFENPAELPASGHWKSPIYILGAMLLSHLNGVTGASFLFFSGLDLFLGCLIAIALYRRSTNSNIDRAGRVPTPDVLIKLAFVSMAGTLFIYLSGLLKGGNNSYAIWQVNLVIYLPIIFLLFQSALRGPKDAAALAKVLIAAGITRACIAFYVMQTVRLPPDAEGNTKIPYATSHHDSILFACAFVLVATMVLHKVRGAKKLALMVLPILVLGMLSNNRRMVWVQIGMVFITLYAATPMTAAKRKLRRFVWAMIPVAIVYVIVGWNHPTGVFKPVATIRSVVEPSTDLSSLEREIENYDLMCTIRQNPLIGVGYGNPYLEVVALLPMGYDLEPYIPHNSILGLWAYSGCLGFTSMTLLWSAGVYFGARAYKHSKKPVEKTAAIMSYASVLIYMVQCWGDLGLGSWTGVFMVAPAISLGGKLCVATGAWELPKKRNKTVMAEAEPVHHEVGVPPADPRRVEPI